MDKKKFQKQPPTARNSTELDYMRTLATTTFKSVRASNEIPRGDEWVYSESFPEFLQKLQAVRKNITRMMQDMLHRFGVPHKLQTRDLEEKFNVISDVNDAILEKVDNSLDELQGLRKKTQPLALVSADISTWNIHSASWNRIKTKHPSPSNVKVIKTSNIEKPQDKYKWKIDNSINSFVPILKDKPNSKKPLAVLVFSNDDGNEAYDHPYEYELDLFKPPANQLQEVTPQTPISLDSTPFTFVAKPSQLQTMMNDLCNQTEIAVDVEHHSFRSFLGLTCLVQISTRKADYIVDALKLRNQLQCLNEVFTKPSIIKVFHGADKDIQWLQRDCGVYVVNMFDTYQAGKVLNLPRLSLAYLLKNYCNVDANKEYQVADWRVRPVPDEMVKYAREDTHYLLYIYDFLKNELLQRGNDEKNLLTSVIQQSTVVCKIRYEKPRTHSQNSHMYIYHRGKRLFNNRQMWAFKELYRWRDNIARETDESTGYVLPNHMLLQICDNLPREMQGILSCCKPVPILVKQNLAEIHHFICRARNMELQIDSMMDQSIEHAPNTMKIDVDSILYCPHDFSHDEFRDDLPTTVDNPDINQLSADDITIRVNCHTSPSITVLTRKIQTVPPIKPPLNFTSPYEGNVLMNEAKKIYQDMKANPQRKTEDLDPRIQPLVEFYKEIVAEENRKKYTQQTTEAKKETQMNIDTSDEEAIPLIKQLPKKRKKKSEPETSEELKQTTTPEIPSEPPPKMQCTPETTPRQPEFTPYNYGDVDYEEFGGGDRQQKGGRNRDRGRLKHQPPPNTQQITQRRFRGKISDPSRGAGRSYTYRK